VASTSIPTPATRPAPARRAAWLLACLTLLLAPPAGAQPPAGAPSEDPEATSASVLESLFVQRNRRTGDVEPLGTFLVWALLAASVGSWGLMVSLHRANRRERFLPTGLAERARDAFASVDLDALRARLDDEQVEQTHLAALLRETIDAGAPEPGAMSDALARAAEEHAARRLRRVEILSTIGAIAPMVGLFGTVYGMILAFQEIVAAGGSPDPVGLAAGIGTALTTTFWGLVVAIPALAGSALLRTRIDALASETELAAERALAAHPGEQSPPQRDAQANEPASSDEKSRKSRRKLAG